MKLSFVIPSYNCVTWLPHAVTSCLEQKHDNIEVVIVDDGSTDYTWQYLKSLEANPKIRIHVNPVKLGRSVSRNIGNKLASGDVICVLDADDIAEPRRAIITSEKFSGSSIRYLYGSARLIEADGIIVGQENAVSFNFDEAKKTLLNRIVHSTVAYSKELALTYPYQDGVISELGIDDWAQQIQLAHADIRLDHTPQVLSQYRRYQGQTMECRDNERVKIAKEDFMAVLGQKSLESIPT